MSYTLENLANDCRAALTGDPDTKGRQKVVELVKKALSDDAFVETHLGANATDERRVIFEDDALGFCICAHVYAGPARGTPHDHGPTWAIYGQAAGETEMTDWDIVTPATGDQPALVKLGRTYTLRPGDAHLYEPGDVHAPLRDAPTRLLRIEGQDTAHITRTPIKAIDQTQA